MKTADAAYGAWGVALLCLGAVAGCGREDVSAKRSAKPPKKDVSEAITLNAADARIRPIGRVDVRGGARNFGWPASGFAFRFEGSAAAIRLVDSPAPLKDAAPDWLSVTVDDGDPQPIELAYGLHDYTVANHLPPGPHTVLVRKRTEGGLGMVSLRAVILPKGGTFLPPPPPRRRSLLAIGDSITAGFGLDGPNADCPFGAATEDGTRTYPALAARELDADYAAIAWSGKGVVQNADPVDKELLIDILGRTLPTDAGSVEPLPAADIVVANLGTNDFADIVPPPSAPKFAAGMDKLLTLVRSTYPEALVVVIVGPLLYDKPRGLKARTIAGRAIKGVVRKRNDSRMALLEMSLDMKKDGVGCQFHPSAATHGRLAAELIAFIRAQGVRD